ncbi:MAG: hypothetical protein ACR2J3_11965 [Aridibacter sp.]
MYLTTKDKKQIDSDLITLIERYFYEKKNSENVLSRYYISQVDYKLVDYQKGQMRGEDNQPFMFYVQFSEIKNNIKSVCKILLEFSKIKIYKQFELGYEIRFFDFSRIREENQENQIRYLNKQLLESPKTIVNEFAKFMQETANLYDAMKK